ncbi:hypothetical protein C8A05DRAFT_29485 [Staphylotrichum tortipilum]|uniref:Uncharacterized protein n=1 Tax=Staphylotrichum tortipilum TaxID=2831512 RepID=A0AAN6RX07_9PEZI|nr:hypothetical protein C8A05DRAFT_29485 [Staphylotrichum longicolle]
MRASLVLASATLAAGSRLECVQSNSRQLAVAASCGDEGSLNYCFSHLPDSTLPEALSPALERCFVSAGCTPTESTVEAFWAIKRCDSPSADLRRARRQPNADGALAAAAAEPLLAARNPLPAAMVTAMDNNLIPRQDDPATTSNASPSPCFTDTETSITTCPTQTTGSESGKKLSCYPTVTTTAKCREGLICQADGQGNPSCMYKHSSLDLGGIIIAVIFASAIVIAVVSICFMCCRERREHRRIERAAEAARIAKEAKTQATVASKRPGVSVTGGVGAGAAVEGQPLMYQGGGGGPSSPGPQQQYFPPQGQMPMQSQGYGGANPFADGHETHPALR